MNMSNTYRRAVYCVLYFFGWQYAAAGDPIPAIPGGNGRMLALGGSPSNYYMEDYTNIFFNPAYLKKYSDLALVELGNGISTSSPFSASNQQYGATLAVGEVTFGLVTGRREGPMFAENSYGCTSGGSFTAIDYMKSALDTYLQNLSIQSTSEPLTPIQLLSAFPLGTATVGVALYRSVWSRDDDGSGSVSSGRTCSASLGQFGIKAGVLYPVDSLVVVDVSGGVQMNTASADYSNSNALAPLSTSSFSVTGFELSALGRVWYHWKPSLTIIPMVRAVLFSYEPEVKSSPQANYLFPLPNSYSKMELELGVGIQSQWEHGIAVLGLSAQYIRLANDATSNISSVPQVTRYTRTWLDLPKINAGFEFFITSWLVGRAGYTKRISSQTTRVEAPAPGAPTESTISQEPGFLPSFGLSASEQTVSLGLGILIERFAINGYLAEQSLMEGPYVLSGVQQSLFGIVSLSYHF
jgi:hypothetical protein